MTWRRTRLVIAVLGVGLAIPALGPGLGGGATAQSDDDAAARAAAEIQAARDRANTAAAAWTEAGIELEELDEQVAELQTEFDALQADVEQLRGETEQVAINRYMAAGAGAMTIFEGPQAATDQIVANELVATATNSSTSAMDDYAVAAADLEDLRQELDDKEDELEDKRDAYAAAEDAAEAEVERLQEVEAQRLEDERVRRILEAQRAEELRQQQAEAEARAAQAQQPATTSQSQTQAPDAPAAQPSPAQPELPAAPAPSGGGGEAPSTPAPSDDDGSKEEPQPTAPPQTAPKPTAPPAPEPPRSGIACPVRGSAYSDTWGAARSGGRSHQGVDMLAGTGTPIVAVVSGSVQFKQTRLGGNSAWISGNDGNRYFFGHLSAFAGSSRSVSQGEVIGYVGDTGNARGTPHLHFEVHPGGGAATNPYPYVRAAGC
ncbi:MAG TPA: peptidoglycan DD-metalloendopeptidase family protein [Desertimonas sp.]|nr:peptidoglycan DD-metalloendopeptidase family protein [Desertimonas sp.]